MAFVDAALGSAPAARNKFREGRVSEEHREAEDGKPVGREGLRGAGIRRQESADGGCVARGRRLEQVDGAAALAEHVDESRVPAIHGVEHERRSVGAARVHEGGIGVEERLDGAGVALSDCGGEGVRRGAHASPQLAGGGFPSAGGTVAGGAGGAGDGAGAGGGSPFGKASALQK